MDEGREQEERQQPTSSQLSTALAQIPLSNISNVDVRESTDSNGQKSVTIIIVNCDHAQHSSSSHCASPTNFTRPKPFAELPPPPTYEEVARENVYPTVAAPLLRPIEINEDSRSERWINQWCVPNNPMILLAIVCGCVLGLAIVGVIVGVVWLIAAT